MTTPKITDWKTIEGTVFANPDKHVSGVSLELVANDSVVRDASNVDADIYFTDIMFQAGGQRTGWVPNTQEMLAPVIHHDDEHDMTNGPTDVFIGPQPQIYKELKTRQFNIVGRGHSVITIPNYHVTSQPAGASIVPGDYAVETLPTGLDLTLYPKEDYSMLRVSTNYGWFEPDPNKRRYDYNLINDPAANWTAAEKAELTEKFFYHPLHYRYTREFWVDGGTAGSKIEINASTRIAKLNGTDIPIGGEYMFPIADPRSGTSYDMPIGRKQFILAPKGSLRLRIEFYSFQNYVDRLGNAGYQWDSGIGFYGTAKFNQWTYGKERI